MKYKWTVNGVEETPESGNFIDYTYSLWKKFVKWFNGESDGSELAEDPGVDTAWSTLCDLVSNYISPSFARTMRGSKSLKKSDLIKEFSKLSTSNTKNITQLNNKISAMLAASNNASSSASMQRTKGQIKDKIKQAYNDISNKTAAQSAIDMAQNIASRAGEDLTVTEARSMIEPYAEIVEERIK